MCKVFFLVCFLMLITCFAQASYQVIDGDSIMVNGVERRLSGIDAPEYNQVCLDAGNKEYSCGKTSINYLKKIVNNNIKCKTITTDRYKRKVSTCKVDGLDINKEMVLQGMAVSYNHYDAAYEEAEEEAKVAKRGVWQGTFMRPELFRALKRK